MTHGKIVNKQTGLEIPVKDFFESTSYWYVGMEGCEFAMPFLQSEWDFVADRPALPTEPGLYKATEDAKFPARDHLLLLTPSGNWYWLSPTAGTTYTPEEELEKFAETITRVEV